MPGIGYILREFGVDLRRTFRSSKGLFKYFQNLRSIRELISKNNSPFPVKKYYPCLTDRFEDAGQFDIHYFLQDWFIANLIYKNNPVKHVDIGSKIDSFVSHVAVFREIEVVDIRPLNIDIPNIKFVEANVMSENFDFIDYCDSVSSLHVLEHFGLGRYGDPIDTEGHLKGINNITRMLKNGGTFYFSTPIGDQRIEFDAHRVFSVSYLVDLFVKSYDIKSFHYIDDNGKFNSNAELSNNNVTKNFGCNYGCGIFELIKK